MLSAPWRKMLRDLWLNRGRTALVVLSIAVGVAGVGAIGQARFVALSGMAAAHADANPASAILHTSPLAAALVEQVQALPGVAVAEGRYTALGRVSGADVSPPADASWRPLQLFALPGDGATRIHRVLPLAGSWLPPPGEIALERTSLRYLGAKVGDRIAVEMPDGSIHRLRVTGSVRDPARWTTFVSGVSYGYISFATLEQLGLQPTLNQLYVTVAGSPVDRERIQRVTARVRHALEQSGHHVHATTLPPPGKHWAAAIIESMSLILGRMGILLLVMGSALVINTILGLMARERRQIGVMKVLGAGTGQIALLYLGMVLLFGLLALALGAPLGALAAGQIMRSSVAYLNFESPSGAIAPPVMALMIAVGLAVPLLAALYPVIVSSRTSVREAIDSLGARSGFGREAIDRALERVQGLPRPLLLSLRNTFRRKGRLLLTLAALGLSGAMLIAVVSLRASLDLTLANSLQVHRYDLQVIFSRSHPAALVEQEMLRIPGVERAEHWGLQAVRRIRPDGTEGGELTLIAPPPESTLLQPTLTEGRWLRHGDERALVLESSVLLEEPGIKVGDRVRLRLRGQETEWDVVGLVRKPLGEPLLYVSRAALAKLTGNEEGAVMVEAVTSRHDTAFQTQVARRAQDRFGRLGMPIIAAVSTGEIREVTAAKFRIVTLFLGAMAVLMALVAALGLTGSMSLNVLERTREMGVMRTIGASHGAIWRIVVAEGMTIGLISWPIATVLAYPISLELSRSVGQAIAQTPLDHVFPVSGILLWLVGALTLSMLASFLPAWNAARLTIREVLAYE